MVVAECFYDKIDFHEAHLSPREKVIFSGANRDKKRTWLSGRIAAKRAFQKHVALEFGISPKLEEVEVSCDIHGKPKISFIDNHDKFGSYCETDLSIAHADGLAMAAVSRIKDFGLVGIDIEKKRFFKTSIADAFLSANELDFIADSANDGDILKTVFWCIKEAYLKAKGIGLRQHPATIQVSSPLSGKGKVFDEKDSSAEAFFHVFRCYEDFFVAIVNIKNREQINL